MQIGYSPPPKGASFSAMGGRCIPIRRRALASSNAEIARTLTKKRSLSDVTVQTPLCSSMSLCQSGSRLRTMISRVRFNSIDRKQRKLIA